MKTLLCAWIFFWSLSVSATEMYWTPEARNAYALISALRIDEGITIIRLQSITHPENHIWPYLEDYGEFLRIFVQEDLRKIPAYMAASALRLERLATVPETNPISLMAQGQLRLHQCAMHMQQGQFVGCCNRYQQGLQAAAQKPKTSPGDVANLRLYASLKVAFGAVPDQYRWLVSIVTSLSGTIDEGLGELYSILKTTTPHNNIFFERNGTLHCTGRRETKQSTGTKALQLLYTHFG